MSGHPEPIQQLIDELGKLPGIGSRSAERLAWYLMKVDRAAALDLATAIQHMREVLKPCRICANISENETCGICADDARDGETIMVVESPKDVVAFEQTARYRGHYHVLMGHLSPHEGTRSEHLTVKRLLERVDRGGVREVILATNPHAEGDGTALLLLEELSSREVTVTRLARGLPTGFTIEYAGTEILAEALDGRRRAALEDD